MLKRLLPCFLISLPLLSPAETYRVGPTRPYADLQAVAPLLRPGDLVEVDGDSTYGGDVAFTEPGTPEDPITIRGIRVNGHRPVLSGGTNTVQFTTPWPYDGPGADYYVFEGFEVTGGSSRGIFHQAHDLTVRDVLVRDCPAHGILGADQGSGNCTLERVEVTRCGSGDSRHQIYMATDEVNRPGSVFRMSHCYVHDGSGGNNVKSRAERNEIYYSWIENARYHELELIGPDPWGAPDGWDEALAREDSDVVGNVLIQHNSFYMIRLGGDATGQSWGRYRFVNNTIVAGLGAVFRLFDGIQSVEMHNNVICMPGTSAPDIVRNAEVLWSDGEQVSGSHNWVTAGSQNVPAQWTGTLSAPFPGFEDISTFDLRPAVGSPLIGAANGGPASVPGFEFPDPLFPPVWHPVTPADFASGSAMPRPVEGPLDIGAFEWTSPIDGLCVDEDNLTGTEDGTPEHPYSKIQAALDAAASGDTVLVAAGSYEENVVIQDMGVTLLGGYAGGTSAGYASGTGGNFAGRDPASHVTTIHGDGSTGTVRFYRTTYDEPDPSLVDGFTITGGRHGVLMDTASWPRPEQITVSNSIIEGNGVTDEYDHLGGGVLLSGNWITLSGNTIRNNHAGRGGGVGGAAGVTLEENLIENNVSHGDHGGGLYLGGSGTIRGNRIYGNVTGGELGYGWGGGGLIFGNFFFFGNDIAFNAAPSHGGGLHIDEGGCVDFSRDLIRANMTTESWAGGGAGLAVDDGEGLPSCASLYFCTVACNTSPGTNGGNGVYATGASSVVVQNTIFWGNDASDFYAFGPEAVIDVSYSLSAEQPPGAGNIASDPLFADPHGGDFHLRSTAGRWETDGEAWVIDGEHSPAIDAADPGAPCGAETEPNGGRANLGIYGNTGEASRSGSGGPHSPGDCDENGSISIGEVQRAVNMFLGFEAPECGVDGDSSGTVSVGEVQAVINGFLGGSRQLFSGGRELTPPPPRR